MSWQELVVNLAPVVVSFVSAIVLFCRTGQKKYIEKYIQAMHVKSTVKQPVESDVTIKTDTTELQFRPSDYGLTVDEVVMAFRAFKAFLETFLVVETKQDDNANR